MKKQKQSYIHQEYDIKRVNELENHSSSQEQLDQVKTFKEVRNHKKIMEQKKMFQDNKNRTKRKLCQNSKQCMIYSLIVVLIISGFILILNYWQELQQIDHLTQELKQKNIDLDIQTKQDIYCLFYFLGDYIRKIMPIFKSQKIQEKYQFQRKKQIWIFPQQNTESKQKQFAKRIYDRTKERAHKNNYQLLTITDNNWKSYVDYEQANKLSSCIQSLQTKKQNSMLQYSNSTSPSFYKIKRELIILQILYKNGGIYIDSNAIITESLNWLNQVEFNPLSNTANRGIKPSVVGFYSSLHSSILTKEDTQTSRQNNKFIVKHPSIQPYFISAEPFSQFVKDWLIQYYTIIKNPEQIENLIQQYDIEIPSLKQQYHLNKSFYLSSQLTLRKKQQQLLNKNISMIGINYYNITTINQNFGPNKLNFILGSYSVDLIYRYLSLIYLYELEQQFGKMNFFTLLKPLDDIIYLFNKDYERKTILRGSFLSELIFDFQQYVNNTSFLQINSGFAVLINKWERLPKQVWTYLQRPVQQNQLLIQLWVEHVLIRSRKSGFNFTILTPKNINHYLSLESITKISNALSNNKTIIYNKTKVELISLAVLLELGGVWIEPLTILNQNQNWVVETYKDFKIWNRMNILPQVLLNFHPHQGGIYNWDFNERFNFTKQQWNLGFCNFFMVAQRQAKFISDLFDGYLKNIQTPYYDIQQKFKKVAIHQYQRIQQNNHRFLMIDTIKYILAEKEMTNQKLSSVEYYGLWSLNGLMGQFKFKTFSGVIDRSQTSDSFIWKYSQQYIENIMGKIYYPIQIQDASRNSLSQLFHKNYKNLSTAIDSQSILVRHLYKSKEAIIEHDGRVMLEKYSKLKRQIPKYVWLFQSQNITEEIPLIQQCISNINYYSSNSSYQIRVINDKNYRKWLPLQAVSEINNLIQTLKKRIKSQSSNIKDHFALILQKYILLQVLKTHGGIIIHKQVLLLENLTWLDNLQNNPFLNQGSEVNRQVVGFFSPGYSTKRQLWNNKYIIKFPSLDAYFLAAVKHSFFIAELLAKFKQIVLQPSKVKQKVSAFGNETRWLHGDDVYYQSFFLACQFVLRSKQQQLNNDNANGLAIDHYGIFSVNTRFYPHKLTRYFADKNFNVVKLHLTRFTVHELQAMSGPLRFLTILPKFENFNNQVQRMRQQDQSQYILENSFFHQFILLNNSLKGRVTKNKEIMSIDANSKRWNELPNIIWYYQENGIKSSRLIKQLLISNLNKTAAKEGFQFRQINDANVASFIDSNNMIKINKVLESKVNHIHKSHLYRLGVLLKEGGVLIPSNYLAIKDFNWIKDISRLQKPFVFNRFGQLPEVFLWTDTLSSFQNQWIYNESYQTKVGIKLQFLIEFIAAQKKSKLLQDWFENLIMQIQLIGKNNSLIGCSNDQRSSKNDKGLLIFDVLYCTLQRRQELLKVNQSIASEACDYYKLWSASQSLGVNKLGNQLNLDILSQALNPFLWQYPLEAVQQITGSLGSIVRINQNMFSGLQTIINQKKNEDWGHPSSLLVQYLQSKFKSQIQVSTGGKVSFK